VFFLELLIVLVSLVLGILKIIYYVFLVDIMEKNNKYHVKTRIDFKDFHRRSNLSKGKYYVYILTHEIRSANNKT